MDAIKRTPEAFVAFRILTALGHTPANWEHVVIADLAAAAGVSERTFRTAFEERYGVGPARYLQLRNLHRVERALRAADPEEATVADVLLQHGEWQFGRFAARYRRLFGELPSETLRARRAIVQVPSAQQSTRRLNQIAPRWWWRAGFH